jgi:hypothetical protein
VRSTSAVTLTSARRIGSSVNSMSRSSVASGAGSFARHGLAWHEFNGTHLTIRLLRRTGLVWDVRQQPPRVMAAAGR